MNQSVQNKLSNVQVDNKLTKDAVDFAVSSGLLLKSRNESGKVVGYKHVPFVLFPTIISKDSLEFLSQIQSDFNTLMHVVVQDQQFLIDSLEGVADEFTQRLLHIFKEVIASERSMPPELAYVRSDYMFDFDPISGTAPPKQIEINTMSVSFGGIGTQKMCDIHKRVLGKANLPDLVLQLPQNPANQKVAEGFVKAWKLYGNPNAAMIFLLGDFETNTYDQRAFEYAINNINPEIKIKGVKFSSLPGRTQLSNDGTFFIDGEEVGLLYFRAAFQPHHYASEEIWKIRKDMEFSRAIKCPSVGQQLFGSKKMQEIFARKGVVEQFVGETAAANIRRTFSGLYSLEMNEEGDSVVKMAIENSQKYVLKPQREGGGNNIYGEDIAKLLREIGNDSRRSAYILMDLINPKPTPNYAICGGTATKEEVVSELGIYGVYLACGDKMLENYAAGHLLRSKPKDQNDGGVATGVAMLDSPLLV
uniref:Glutathione synthetase n=1 Tax=Phallusia mammillata TaxID=59560 RepID=A0A6F9DEL6_9ASCI|nr:glutathione synthetase-like [Phallusia mammillata]